MCVRVFTVSPCCVLYVFTVLKPDPISGVSTCKSVAMLMWCLVCECERVRI